MNDTTRYYRDSPFDRNVQISNVMQDEVDQLLVVPFTHALDEGL